ncbi:Cupredoxin [Crassisporium funariophilum]|nr:Cupredoxin [Crassisporium funariophilum]
MRSFIAIAALLSAVSVNAVDMLVKVGANGGLVFDPTSVTAAVGDTISFQFQGKNHSVTQSTFPAPCTRQTTPSLGVDSGFMFVPANATSLPQWTFTVNNATTPLWFFCAQTIPVSHCQSGMVFAVNAPPSKTFAQFQAAAKASGGNSTTPGAPAASGSPGVTGGPAGSTPPAGTNAGTSPAATGTAGTTGTTTGGAIKLGSSAAGALTVVALLVGFAL